MGANPRRGFSNTNANKLGRHYSISKKQTKDKWKQHKMTENLYKLKTNITNNVCIVLQIYKCVIDSGFALVVAVA